MELILNNHIRIKYRTTFCFILAMYIFSIVTVSCRPSVDRIPPRPTIDDFSNNNNNKYQLQEQQQEQHDQQQQQQQQQQNIQLQQYEKHKNQEQQHQTDEKNVEKNEYGDLHPDKIRQIKKCNENMELMELCMRCAKVTKSRDVYPMCCDNEDHVKDWCVDYVYYGIGYNK